MGVYIKGWNKPKECYKCPFWQFDAEECQFVDITPDCPLIEVLNHGDLADKNKMIDVLRHGSKLISEMQQYETDEKSIFYCQGVITGYTNSIVALDGAPVVIPEERSRHE